MSVTITKLPDEPILKAELQGRITANDAITLVEESASIADTTYGTIYRITDITNAELSLMEMLSVVAAIREEKPGSANDPRFHNVFVGGARTSRLYTDILSNQAYGGNAIPLFGSESDALEYIRTQRTRETA